MIAYWYIFGALALAVFAWRKDLRREMVWAGLMTIPVMLVEPLLSRNFAILTIDGGGRLLERLVASFALGALASILYELLLGKVLTPQRHPQRRRLLWLLSGVAVFIGLAVGFHQSFFLSLLVGLAVDLIVVMSIRPDLLWDTVVSGVALAFLYGLVWLAISSTTAVSTTTSLNNRLFAVDVFPRSLSELVAVFLFGALWGPLYAAVKHYRQTPPDEFHPASLHPKIALSILMLLGAVGASVWLANEFVLPPSVLAVTPKPNVGNVGLTDAITIRFSRPVDRNRLAIDITPDINGHWQFADPTVGQHAYRQAIFTPDPAWQPARLYSLTLRNVSSLLGNGRRQWTYHFTTADLPTVTATSIQAGQAIDPCEPITVALSGPNDGTVDFSWLFDPNVRVSETLSADHRSYLLKPEECFLPGTVYTLTVERAVIVKAGMTEAAGSTEPIPVYSQTFRSAGAAPTPVSTPSPLTIREVAPRSGASGVGVRSTIRVNFSQPVDHDAAESRLTISPKVTGSFSWDGQVMIFKPSQSLAFATRYSVTVSAGVTAVNGQTLVDDYRWSFATAPFATLLNIAQDYQDKPLSCEAAALKMALAGKGVKVSEDEIMAVVGFDPTPHQNGVWGDPDVAYVGNISGRQNTTGYGVHWAPIAKAANHWRSAASFSNWTVSQLAQEVAQGNPVVIWGVVGRAYADSWRTPSGKLVKAWKGEHTRTVIGFIGTPTEPSSFILNDPYVGRITWTAATLKGNWVAFGNSGVVVR